MSVRLRWEALFLLVALLLPGCDFLLAISPIPTFRGMEEVVATPAADFQLTTHSGQRLRLGELKARVVVLTFLNTECSGGCQATARRIVEASAQMDYYQEAGRVVFLAVTTAPETDTVERAAWFCHLLGVPANFAFLTGSREEVEPVWRSYDVPVARAASPEEPARLVLIDPEGRVRGYLKSLDFKPDDLRHNIRLLLSEQALLARPLCH